MGKRKGRRPFGSVFKRHASQVWRVQFTWRQRRYRRAGGKTKAEARKRLATIEALLRSGVAPSKALATVFDLGVTVEDGPTLAALEAPYLAHIGQTLRPSTVAADTRRLARLIRTLPFARTPLASVQRRDVAAFMETRLRKAAPSTVNRDLSLLSAVFRFAIENDLVSRNPVRDVRRPSEQGRARDAFLTPQDVKHLLSKVAEAIRPLVLVLLSTGARLGEALALTWDDVDLDGEKIHIRGATSKRGKGRRVPLTPEALTEFRKLRLRRGEVDRVFTIPAWKARRFLTAARDALVDEETGKPLIPEATRKVLCFHLLRHTCASWMVQAGVPLYEVGALLGHTSTQTTARYAHLAPDHGKAAVGFISEALRVV